MTMLLSAFLCLIILLILFRNLVICSIKIRYISNRYVFITGCDTGFGNLLAKKLDSLRVKVIAGCLTEKERKDLEGDVSTRLKTVLLDVTKKASVHDAQKCVKDKVGEQGLWGVVNDAGIMPNIAQAEWIPFEDYETVCKVNYLGVVTVSLTFLPLMHQAKGHLVNVCSVAGNFPHPGLSGYSPTKAAVKAFSVALRRELYKTGITVHTIDPGAFKTHICEQGKLLDSTKEAYKRSSSYLQQYYGGNILARVLKRIHAGNYASPKLHQAVDVMIHALIAKYPKKSYTVGFNANTIYQVFKRLPDWFVDLVLGWPAPYGKLCDDFE